MRHLYLIPAIHRSTHRIGLAIQRYAPDVTQAEAHILCHLHENGDSPIAELHRAFAHKRSTLTSVLDRMALKRWITRESSGRDRRSFVIGLTAAGRRKAVRVHQLLESLEDDALHGVNQSAREALQKILGELGGAGI